MEEPKHQLTRVLTTREWRKGRRVGDVIAEIEAELFATAPGATPQTHRVFWEVRPVGRQYAHRITGTLHTIADWERAHRRSLAMIEGTESPP